MRPILPIMVAIVLAGSCTAPILAVNKAMAQPFGGQAAPGRHMEERPFGGPSPKNRSVVRNGKKCAFSEDPASTKVQTCDLENEDRVGKKCTCPGVATQGKVIE
jgi:hypothetical protein